MIAASPLVTRSEAVKQRTHHQLLRGIGYLKHSGPPELPASARGSKNCEPGAGTRNGTIHLMKPPGGAKPLEMIWVAAERAWASAIPDRGNRLAWPTSHLMRARWEYVGPIRK